MSFNVPGITKSLESSDSISNKSPNFTWGEATKNGGRIPKTESITANIIKLAIALEKLRADLGGKSISITSWYRDPVSNRQVGGAKDSRHLYGDAADINIEGMSPQEVQDYLDPIWEGGLGYGKTFTHCDLRGSRARWNYGS